AAGGQIEHHHQNDRQYHPVSSIDPGRGPEGVAISHGVFPASAGGALHCRSGVAQDVAPDFPVYGPDTSHSAPFSGLSGSADQPVAGFAVQAPAGFAAAPARPARSGPPQSITVSVPSGFSSDNADHAGYRVQSPPRQGNDKWS